jgi:hypothetical protein
VIGLTIAAARSHGDPRRRLLRALRRAIEDRRVEVFGELQRIEAQLAIQNAHPSLTFERGFLTRLHHRGTATSLYDLLSAGAACFLRSLSAPGAESVIRLLEAVGSKSLTSLALSSCAAPLEQHLAAALPRVRRLQLVGLLPRAIAWPLLSELSFIGTGARNDEPAYLDVHLPDLTALRLVACDDRDRARLLAIARAPLPKLRALSFRGRAELFREIAHAEWFAGLERLEIIRADDEIIARLSQLVAQRRNLRRLRVVAPHLATEAKRALARRLASHVPKARVS